MDHPHPLSPDTVRSPQVAPTPARLSHGPCSWSARLHWGARRLGAVTLLLGVAQTLHAQNPTPPAAPVAPTASAVLPLSTPNTAPPPSVVPVQAEAASPATATPGTSSPTTASTDNCRSLSDRALNADLKAANAQSAKADARTQSALLDESLALWAQAAERCEGRAQDRARRNLADNQRSRQALSAELGATPECTLSSKNATSLQDLAQQALRERRWLDAALLYRKAETQWDVAAELCQGPAQQQAQERLEQTATDGHNAEFCAPVFERARDLTQQLRRQGGSLSTPDKQALSQTAETVWRDAQNQCKGAALDLARSNANTLAKDRGTPWVPTLAAPNTPTPATDSAATVAGLAPGVGAPGPRSAQAPSQNGAAARVGVAAPVATTGGASSATATATATAVTATAEPTQDLDLVAGGTRFQGRFSRHGAHLTGNGRVTWANGDAYTGDLVAGQRHGQGEFVWANGQRYQGPWVQDVPQGRGVLQFTNGNRYEGQVVRGEPHGQGTMTYASGDRYQGGFAAGKSQGQGVYRWASGQTYEGPWINDQPQGLGQLVFANGNRYEGELALGSPHGQGVMTYASGDRYEGQFERGQAHGQGRYAWTNGDRYSGAWQQGLKQGQGLFEWAQGDRWEGLFEADNPTDKGTLTRKNP